MIIRMLENLRYSMERLSRALLSQEMSLMHHLNEEEFTK